MLFLLATNIPLIIAMLLLHAAVNPPHQPMKKLIVTFASLITFLLPLQAAYVEPDLAGLRTIHVAPMAADAAKVQDGSADAPYLGIEAARSSIMSSLSAGTPVRVLLEPGVYRGKVRYVINPQNTTAVETPLVFEGSNAGSVALTGLVTEGYEPETWTPVEGYPGVFAHDWEIAMPAFVGYWADDAGAVIDGLGARREMVVVDGRRFDQKELEIFRWRDPDGKSGFGNEEKQAGNQPGTYAYTGLNPLELGVLEEPYSFAVAEHPNTPEHLRNRLFIRLPEGKTPADYAAIEVGTKLGHAANNDVLWDFKNKNNVVLRNLVIRHASTLALGHAVYFRNGKNILVEDCEFRENGGIGLGFGEWGGPMLQDITVRRSRFIEQGYNAIKPTLVDNALFEDVHMSMGNWRGDMGNFHGWDAAAVKTALSKNVTFRRCSAVGNQTNGFWHDIDNVNIAYEACFAYRNRGIGFFFELSRNGTGGDRLIDSVSAYNDVGLLLANISRSEITNNFFVNNRNQIEVTDFHNRDPMMTEDIEYLMIHNNVFIDSARMPNFITVRKTDGRTDTSMQRVMALNLADNDYQSNGGGGFYYNSADEKLSFDLEGWRQFLTESGSIPDNERGSFADDITYDELDLLAVKSPLVAEMQMMGTAYPFDSMQAVRAKLDARANERIDRLAWTWPLARTLDDAAWTQVDLSAVGNNHPSRTSAIVKLVPGQFPSSGPVYGVPMHIDFAPSGTIAMRSARFSEDTHGNPLPESVSIPIGQKARALYILHGASYAFEAGNYGSYIIEYDDGTQFEKAIRSPGNDRNQINFDPTYVTQALVQDWWHDYKPFDNGFMRAVPILVSKDSDEANPKHLYQVQLQNPHPEKTIMNLKLTSNPELQGRVILFALTLGG